MMDTNGPDQDDASRHPGGNESAPAADNWLDELLNPAAADPDKDDAHPTEPGTPPATAADDAKEAVAPPPQEIDPPFIGRYQVIRPLGQGGFGRVFLARDADLRRQVAIKVPIIREGQAAGFLRDEFDAEVIADNCYGTYVFEMEITVIQRLEPALYRERLDRRLRVQVLPLIRAAEWHSARSH